MENDKFTFGSPLLTSKNHKRSDSLERIDNFFSLFKSFDSIEPVALTMVTSMLILTKKYYKIFQIDSNYLRIKMNYFAL